MNEQSKNMANASTRSCQTVSPILTHKVSSADVYQNSPLTLLTTWEINRSHTLKNTHIHTGGHSLPKPCSCGRDQVLPKASHPVNSLHVGNGRYMYSPYKHEGRLVLSKEGHNGAQLVSLRSLWLQAERDVSHPREFINPGPTAPPTPHPGRQKTQLPETLQTVSDRFGYFTAVPRVDKQRYRTACDS